MSRNCWQDEIYNEFIKKLDGLMREGKKYFEYNFKSHVYLVDYPVTEYVSEVRYDSESHSVYMRTTDKLNLDTYEPMPLRELKSMMEAYNNYHSFNPDTARELSLMIYLISGDGKRGDVFWVDDFASISSLNTQANWGSYEVNSYHLVTLNGGKKYFTDGTKERFSLIQEDLSDHARKIIDYYENFGDMDSVPSSEMIREGYSDMVFGLYGASIYKDVADLLVKKIVSMVAWSEVLSRKRNKYEDESISLLASDLFYSKNHDRLYLLKENMEVILKSEDGRPVFNAEESSMAQGMLDRKEIFSLKKHIMKKINELNQK